MKIYERLRQHRSKSGYTQKSIAKKAGISNQRLSAIERGAIKLSVDEFEHICIYGYGINPCIFFADRFSENEN